MSFTIIVLLTYLINDNDFIKFYDWNTKKSRIVKLKYEEILLFAAAVCATDALAAFVINNNFFNKFKSIFNKT